MKRRWLPLWGLLAGAPVFAQQGTPPDESLAPYANAANTVELADGRRIHFTCMGEGSPTVILTAGLGEWGITWNKVQPAIARTTRVCAWDRAGFGLSDASAIVQTAQATTADLDEALARAFGGPYVMVGHSLGAYESLLFADRRREEVAGMVLVDPSLPDQWNRFARVVPSLDLEELQRPGTEAMRRCATGLRNGTLAPGSPDRTGCLRPFPAAYPPGLRDALEPLRTAERFETMASINSSLGQSSAQAVNPLRDYGTIPLVVLSAASVGAPPEGVSFDSMSLLAEEIDRGHDELAALSRRGAKTRVPGTTHAIHQIRPQVVIDAIEAVVDEARASVAAGK